MLAPVADTHSGGLNNKAAMLAQNHITATERALPAPPKVSDGQSLLTGTIISHVRDGDTVEVDGIAIRLAALNCPENKPKKVRHNSCKTIRRLKNDL